MNDEVELLPKRTRPKLTKKSEKARVKAQRQTLKEKQVVELVAKGLSKSAVARVAHVSPNTVGRIIDKYKDIFQDTDLMEEYQGIRQNLLSAGEFKLLRSVLDDEAIANAPLNHRVYAFDKVTMHRRLDAGLSTANTSLQAKHTIVNTETLDKYRKE